MHQADDLAAQATLPSGKLVLAVGGGGGGGGGLTEARSTRASTRAHTLT